MSLSVWYRRAVLAGAALLWALGITGAVQGPNAAFCFVLGLTLAAGALDASSPVESPLRLSYVFALAGATMLSLRSTVELALLAGIAELTSLHGARLRTWVLAGRVGALAGSMVAANVTFGRALELMPALPVAAHTAAGTVMFAVYSAVMSSVASRDEDAPVRVIWQVRYLWSFPYYLAGVVVSALVAGPAPEKRWHYGLVLLPVVVLVARAYQMQRRRMAVSGEIRQQSMLQQRMMEVLALSMQARRPGGAQRAERVVHYAQTLGRKIGVGSGHLEELRCAALLHDLGMLAIPEYVLNKTGPLTPEEREQIQRHPTAGAEILERASFPPGVVDAVRAHHERWDGRGYPEGSKGWKIPFGARLLALAEAIESWQVENQVQSLEELDGLKAALQKESGKRFDPQMVEVALQNWQELFTGDSAGMHDEGVLAAMTEAWQEEKAVAELLEIAASSLNLRDLGNRLGRRIGELVPHETMVLLAGKDGRLTPQCVVGENFSLFSQVEVEVWKGPLGLSLKEGRPVVNADPRQLLTPAAYGDKLQHYRSLLQIPLNSGNDAGQAALLLFARGANAFTAPQVRMLTALAPRLAVSVEHALLFTKAENDAAQDALTGLPNAGSLFVRLQQELARAARADETVAVLVCDLDGFKKINDTLGHLTGNKILQGVAQGMKEHVREYDFVARMGGDEFVIVLPGLEAEAVQLRRKRLGEMVKKVGREICGEEMLGLSLGEAHFPADGRTADELLAKADDRMYANKRERKAQQLAGMYRTAHAWEQHQAG